MQIRRILLLFFLLPAVAVSAQMKVTVTPTGTHFWCFKDSVGYTATVTGADTAGITYRWQKDGTDIPNSDTSRLIFHTAKPADTGQYRCIISRHDTVDTSNIVILRMYPPMKIDTLYRYNELACPLQCKGQFKVLVSGGTPYAPPLAPYNYYWHAGHAQDTLCFGICPGKHRLTIQDQNCYFDTNYFVDVLKAPKVRYKILPGDTIYLTNPTATLQFNDTCNKYMTSWKYYMNYNGSDSTITVSNVNPVTFNYDKSGVMVTQMKFRDLNGCDTTLTDSLYVRIINLFIPNVMTTNPPNDKLVFKQIYSEGNYQDITLSEVYLSNELWIYDRWGRRVYHTTNYVNGTWDISKLPDGTYFFIFTGHGLYGDDHHHGSITIFK